MHPDNYLPISKTLSDLIVNLHLKLNTQIIPNFQVTFITNNFVCARQIKFLHVHDEMMMMIQ